MTFLPSAWLESSDASAASRRKLSGRILRVLFVRSAGVAALFALEIVLARSLGAADYGAFNVALAIATVAARLAPMGWLNASTRLLSAYTNAQQFGLIKGVLLQAYATTIAGLAVFLGALGFARFMWPGTPDNIVPAYMALLATAVTLLELHRYLLRGFHAGDLGEALPTLMLPVGVIGLVLALGLHDPGRAVVYYGAICVPLLAISAVAVAKFTPPATWKTAAEWRVGEWAFAAAAMLVGSLSDELVSRTAVLILGFTGDNHGAGLYQAASRLALMNVFMLRIITPVAAPWISVMFNDGRLEELRTSYLRLCLLSLAGALPLAVAFWAVPTLVLGWFGNEFVGAAAILRLLGLGYLISAAAGPCATALMMVDKERTYSKLALGFAAFNFVATFILSALYGADGAAVATAATLIAANITYFICFWRTIKP
ncbi:O-antigen/teichoic acid export membrane protein [Mesorhizobium shonense]|uniref:O-antigen/teichoic acid export membrane protein n=1 Tax=Mesorhizobium shonense TaxID=1209948 RepID=A0ABV2HVE0_9HYPH|nr:lipopolysaccharide biosynthesis protein [Mesorhizobium sp.]TIS46282.1 MAG: lipopolysaccharide biosynthesis protein [Mesorhizobium sp.]